MIDVEPARHSFAITVHQAQGSELSEVWLQPPNTESRVLSRELLYTGLTRVRSACIWQGVRR